MIARVEKSNASLRVASIYYHAPLAEGWVTVSKRFTGLGKLPVAVGSRVVESQAARIPAEFVQFKIFW